MRISTILFLALFAGIFGNFHRQHQARSHAAFEAAYQASGRAVTAATRELEQELAQISRRLRDSDRSVRSLDQAAQRLQELLRHSEHTRCNQSSHASAAARAANQREITQQLAEVLAGRQHLVDEKAGLVGRQAILQARLEMARAGLLPQEDEEGIDYGSFEKPSPLEALTEAAGRASQSTVLVVR